VKKINNWIYGESIPHIYVGPFEMEPLGEIMHLTKDVFKIPQHGVATMAGGSFVL
jgi:hypothetical protein